jgi:hypothetical protein
MYARTINNNKPPPSNQNSKEPKQHEYINKNSKKIREQKKSENNGPKLEKQKRSCCSCRNWKKRKTEIKSRGRLLSASPS